VTFQVPETPSAFHRPAQRTDFRRRDARQRFSNRIASREKITGEPWNGGLGLRAGYTVFLFHSFQSATVASAIASAD
jgi:hypothetical protein